MEEYKYTPECKARCPELQSCAGEYILRLSDEPGLVLNDVYQEHIDAETLPSSCSSGPLKRTPSNYSSRAKLEEVAQASIVKVDAWGDMSTIVCRSQGNIGLGNIGSVE